MAESAYLSTTRDSRQLQSIPHHAPSSPLWMEAIFAAAKDLYPRVMDCQLWEEHAFKPFHVVAGESPRVQGQQRGEFFALGEKLAATEEELRGEAQTAPLPQRQVLEGSGGQVQRGQRGEAASRR